MINLTGKPFFLNEEKVAWVNETLKSMTLEEKIGQIFILMSAIPVVNETEIESNLSKYHQGGLRWQGGDSNFVYNQSNAYQKYSKIPLFIAANCDEGGIGCMSDGTHIASAVQAAAGGNTQTAYNMGFAIAKEVGSVGVNWLFNPVSDIYFNWRNTIVNTRCFGDNADTVIENARAFMQGVRDSNVNIACCCKHFPGDGVEELDQHLVMGVNNLSVEEWRNSFGKVYKAMIDEGIESFMIGHIALPEMTKMLKPNIKDEDIMPATLSPELIQGVLRDELNFNGLVLTDATHMIGFAGKESRKNALAKAVASGCDMVLFANDTEEDIKYIKQAIEDKSLTIERLNDAVTRVLALKAKLGLNVESNVMPASDLKDKEVGNTAYLQMAKKAADDCITLVKDTKHYLPIDINKKNRVLLVYVEETPNSKGFAGSKTKQVIADKLSNAGFVVDSVDSFYDLEIKNGVTPVNFGKMLNKGSMEEFKNKYDYVFLFLNIKGYAQDNNVRVRWSCNHSKENPWYVSEVPTIAVSLNYTTHLIDIPQVHSYINAYGSSESILDQLIDKICGKSQFKGVASETVFCDRWDTKL